jgi:hypothetical protein
VSARQIFDPDEFASDGIFVTSSNTSGGGYQSSIVITGEGIRFLFDVLEGMPFPVVCLEVRDQVNIVDADMRRVLIYSTPPPPNDLQVVPTSTLLLYSLEWVRPRSVDECVPINYRVTITNLETNASSFEGVSEESFTYNDTDSDLCQLHEFQVVSTNDAGPGQPVSIRVTLPISPNVEPVSSSLMALPLLDDGVKIQVMFEPATTCNETAHPIVNYIISISELPEVTMNVTHTGSSISAILSSNLLQDDLYTITVSACAAFACRPAQSVTVVTSDVQNATITFLNTTVSLECAFASSGSAVGCRFTLQLPDSTTSETFDLDRPSDESAQLCATTQNMREAYQVITVEAIGSDGGTGSFRVIPLVNETDDVADITPCELPITMIVEGPTLSTAEIVAIIIAVLVVFVLLVIVLSIIVWWRWRDIKTVYQRWVYPLTEEEGIDLMVEDHTDKPTVTMLMRNLVPGPSSSTTTMPKKKALMRESSQQPDMAVAASNAMEEMEHRGGAPGAPPALSGKEPVAAIKMKDPNNPQSLHLLLKPAVLAHVVNKWKSKIGRGAGDEMLLYWREDEEDVDDDEPYFVDPEDNV